MFAAMFPIFLLFASLFTHSITVIPQSTDPAASQIAVVGAVYCDFCFNNTFSSHSYFLPGVDVQIQCKFKASSTATREKITLSVNRTTDTNGVYKVEIPSVDGVDCVQGLVIQSMCQASLIKSPSSGCNIPALNTTTYQISVKSKENNLCIYSFNALSFRPSEINATLCGNQGDQEFPPSSPPNGPQNQNP